MSKWQKEKTSVLEAALRMSRQGLVVGKTGNLSLRLPAGGERELLAITPSGREYDLLSTDDIPVVDFSARTVEGELAPSIETTLHIAVYKARQNIGAVIHFHPVFASVMAVAGLEIPPIIEDQVIFLGGGVKLAGYAASGSDELIENVISALGDRNGALMSHHGALGVGRTMREAFTACEILEKTAKIYLGALSLGKVNLLSPEALERERAVFKRRQNHE
ncbi:MAG: class II aldolase/adducin family protein [Chloroflexi bacterium]|nr:class II aldolase/adducin family protein [Chloroflexota bacterium]